MVGKEKKTSNCTSSQTTKKEKKNSKNEKAGWLTFRPAIFLKKHQTQLINKPANNMIETTLTNQIIIYTTS